MLHTTNFPYEVVGNDSAYILNKVTLFCDVLTRVLFPLAFSFVDNCVFPCGRESPMSGWICQWKPLSIPVGDTFQKACLEVGYELMMGSTSDPGENCIEAVPTADVSTMVRGTEKTYIVPSGTNNLWKRLQHRDQWGSLMLLLGTFLDARVLHPSGKERKHQCLTKSSSVLFLNAWSCRFHVKISCRAVRMWSPLAKTVKHYVGEDRPQRYL